MNIALCTGGISGERQVSIASANNIKELIDFADIEIFIMPDDLQRFLGSYKAFDVAIPMIHGRGGEDGSLQGLFETLGIPYIFSGIQAHSIGIDKRRTKQLVSMLGYSVSKEIDPGHLWYPFFAKPRFGGSSVASGICKSEGDYEKIISQTKEELILEEIIKGREFTVGVVETGNQLVVLPVTEIMSGSGFFDYESKYNADKLAKEVCPAEIDEDLSKKLQAISLAVHKQLNIRHISRSDFIVTGEGQIFFLEINTVPGMTDTSLIPKMITQANLSLKTLLVEWCSGSL